MRNDNPPLGWRRWSKLHQVCMEYIGDGVWVEVGVVNKVKFNNGWELAKEGGVKWK